MNRRCLLSSKFTALRTYWACHHEGTEQYSPKGGPWVNADLQILVTTISDEIGKGGVSMHSSHNWLGSFILAKSNKEMCFLSFHFSSNSFLIMFNEELAYDRVEMKTSPREPQGHSSAVPALGRGQQELKAISKCKASQTNLRRQIKNR